MKALLKSPSPFWCVLQLLSLFSSSLAQGGTPVYSPIYPEDGSLTLSRWVTSFSGGHVPADLETFESTLRGLGVQVLQFGFGYRWMQDLTLFDENGVFLEQTKLEGLTTTERDDLELSNGVCNEDFDPKHVAPLDFKDLPIQSRTLSHLMVEGGEMVTGKLANGETYALVSRLGAVERSQMISKWFGSPLVDHQSAKAHFANELGIKAENVFEVRAGSHLDLFLTALPGGKILLQDYAQSEKLAQKILSSGDPRLTPFQKKYLKLVSDPANPNFDSHKSDDEVYAGVVQDLEGTPLKVIRVPGTFTHQNSEAEFAQTRDRINFFNGFAFKAKTDGRWTQVTNQALIAPGERIYALEEAWEKVLQENRGQDARILFLGTYSNHSGIDCAGAPAGQ